MEFENIKILVEIILALVGAGVGIGTWQRFTNKKKVDEIRELHALTKIELKKVREELAVYKSNDEQLKAILEFNEDEFENNPELASKFSKYLNKKRFSY